MGWEVGVRGETDMIHYWCMVPLLVSIVVFALSFVFIYFWGGGVGGGGLLKMFSLVIQAVYWKKTNLYV